MGSEKWGDLRFGKKVKAERESRNWSQAEMAEILSGRDVQPMHATTIAKIEAGTRSVRISEAVGIADLFDVSLDALLGRNSRPKRDLDYAIGALMEAVYTSKTTLQRISRPLRDRLEDLPTDFDGYITLEEGFREVFGQLDSASAALRKVEDSLISAVDKQVSAEVADELSWRPVT